MRYGPFDAAFLPVNGARRRLPPPRAGLAVPGATWTRQQAAAAAEILDAASAVPIHYDTIHHPPIYAQVDDPAGRFAAAAGDRARVLAIGEELALAVSYSTTTHGAAGGLDGLAGGRRELVGVDGERLGELALGEDLDRTSCACRGPAP